MFTSKDLNALGIPKEKAVMHLAMRLVNVALAHGADENTMRESLRSLVASPETMTDDPILGELAIALKSYLPNGGTYVSREIPAPWRCWKSSEIDPQAVTQMEQACMLPVAVRGALMPDAHVGYGLPIGGVLAVEKAVIPYAVGVDIACRMRLTLLDMPVSALTDNHDALVEALESETRFGVGATFSPGERRQHAVMDEDWSLGKGINTTKDRAWNQLGTSGCGNHFVEFGELHVPEDVRLGNRQIAAGAYLALLSHSGSRGSGEAVASYFSKVAMDMHPNMPRELQRLAWLSLDSEAGQEYWAAMELMGRYAAANHELIHQHILRHLGIEALTHVENHHNFAWREQHNGKDVIVHRKGATPAGAGVQGIVPGSMGSPGFVVQGRGNADALASCSHGAGRRMSRAEAFKTLSADDMQSWLRERHVELLSGTLDESPQAYKDINDVMDSQKDLVDILARFDPRIVKMAPEEGVFRHDRKK